MNLADPSVDTEKDAAFSDFNSLLQEQSESGSGSTCTMRKQDSKKISGWDIKEN